MSVASPPIATPTPPDPDPSPTPRSSDMPYKFLDFFEERDSGSFAGRDREIAGMVARITANRMLVLFARSGWGKTSLLKAGVFPKLREGNFRPVYVRTLTEPIADLRDALATEAKGLGLPLDGVWDLLPEDAVRRLVAAMAESATVVIVLDQFEEIFTLFRKREDARTAFIEAIARLVADNALRLRVVFSLREDYLAELETFARQLPGLFDCRFRLGPLTAFGAREAIVRPLRRAGIEFSQTLVARLLDMLAVDGFEPPILQIVCSEVYRVARKRCPSPVKLLPEDFDKAGGIEKIFGQYLANVTGSINKENLLVTRMILDALMTQEGTKRAVTAEILAREGQFLVPLDVIERILAGLEQKIRLLRAELRNGEVWYELIHDRLVSFAKAWVNTDQEFSNFKIARDIVANGSRGGLFREKPGALLNRGQVDDVVGPYRDQLRVDALESEYLVRSAIYTGSGSASYWAGRHGMAEGVAILLQSLSSDDPSYRPGAASAAGSFDDPDGRIFTAVLALGADPSIEVRQAAGQALAKLRLIPSRRGKAGAGSTPIGSDSIPRKGPTIHFGLARLDAILEAIPAALTGDSSEPRTFGLPGSLARLRPDLASDRPRPDQPTQMSKVGVREGLASLPAELRRAWAAVRAFGLFGALRRLRRDLLTNPPQLDMLAAMSEAGDSLEGFSFWQRVKARRLAATRLRTTYVESTKAQARTGAIAGCVGGAGWCLTVGAVFLGFKQAVGGDGPNQTGAAPSFMVLIVGITLWCALIGAPVGWIGARTTAMDALRGEIRYSPFRLIQGSWLLASFLLIFGIVIALIVGLSGAGAILGFAAGLASSVVAAATIEGLAYLALRSAGGSDPWRILPWAWIVTGSFPFIGFALADRYFAVHSESSEAGLLGAIAAGIGFLAATIAVARRYAARRAGALPPHPVAGTPPSRVARGIVLSGFVASLGLFSAFWGFDTLPVLSRFYTIHLRAGKEAVISARLGPGYPDAAFLEIAADEDSIVNVAGEVPKSVQVHAKGLATLLGESVLQEQRFQTTSPYLFIPAGRHRLDLTTLTTSIPVATPTQQDINFKFDVGRTSGMAQSGAVDYKLTLRPLDIPDMTQTPVPPEGLPRLVKVRFARSPIPTADGRSTWTATIGGPIATPHPERAGGGVEIEPVLTGARRRDVLRGVFRVTVGTCSSEARWFAPPGAFGKGVGAVAGPDGADPADLTLGYRGAIRVDPEVVDGKWSVRFELTTTDDVDPRTVDPYWKVWVLPGPAKPVAPVPPPPVAIEHAPPTLDEAIRRVEQLLNSPGALPDATRICREAIRANPKSGKLRGLRARIYERWGDRGSAAAEYFQAIALEGDTPAYLNNAAWNLCLSGRFAEAYPLAVRANRFTPKEVDYLDTLAHAAYGSSHDEEAVRAWTKVMELSASYFKPTSNHPHCVDDLEHLDEARLRIKIKLDRDFPTDPFAP